MGQVTQAGMKKARIREGARVCRLTEQEQAQLIGQPIAKLFLGSNPEEAYKEFGQDALLKRMGDPKEIAYGALFLASKESSYVTGTQLVIDGGLTPLEKGQLLLSLIHI